MVTFIDFPIYDGVSGGLVPWILWLEDFFVRERFTTEEKMNMAQSLLEGKAYTWFYRNQRMLPFQSWEDLRDNLLLMLGDFDDLDRFLQAQRVEKRRKRRSRTAITPQESISSPATIHETVPIATFSTQQVDEISVEKKDESHEATIVKVLDSLEEESITQTQVPVSKLEHSLPIPKKSLHVCANSQAVVSCEHQRSIQKTIGLDVVNSDAERIQCVMSISKNVSAHQVLDKMCQLKSLKSKNKRKLSLSLKTWMFKFKHTSKRSKSLDVTFFSVEELSSQVVGLDDSHLEQLFYTGLQTEMTEVLKWKEPRGLENQKTDVLRMETSSFCNILGDKPAKQWENQKSFTSKPVTTFAQHTPLLLQNGDNQNTGPSALIPAAKSPAMPPRQRHTAGELDAMRSSGTCRNVQFQLSGVQFQSDFISLALEGVDIILGMQWLETLGTGVVDWKYQEWSFVYDGKPVKFVGDTSLHAPPLLLQPFVVQATSLCLLQDQREVILPQLSFTYKSIPLDGSAVLATSSFQVRYGMGPPPFFQWDPGSTENWVLDVQLGERDLMLFHIHNNFQRAPDILPIKKRCFLELAVGDWVYFRLQPYRQLSVMQRPHQKLIAEFCEPFLVLELLGMVASKLVDFVRLYSISKLEDKLVFGEGSIDTIKQSYFRRKKEESESSKAREVSSANRGFAENN